MSVVGESFRVLQLYPDELGITGDRGNVLAIVTRLTLAGARVEVLHHNRGDRLPQAPDIVVIGNGSLSALRTILDDIQSNASAISGWVSSGVPLLAVGAGMEVLGESITTTEGERLAGIGALPLSTTRGGERRVGYVVIETEIGPVVGLEDHSSVTELTGGKPFGRITHGRTAAVGRSDGIVLNSVIGTRLQGPALPLNPVLTDHLISVAASRRDLAIGAVAELAELDTLAAEARAVIMRHVDDNFTGV